MSFEECVLYPTKHEKSAGFRKVGIPQEIQKRSKFRYSIIDFAWETPTDFPQKSTPKSIF